MADAGDAGLPRTSSPPSPTRPSSISRRLGDGGLDRTLEDARRLARNRPGLFLAGAALAGFVVARVARAADTDSLKQAAAPTDGTNGSDDHPWRSGPRRDLALEAAPPAAGQPPLGADPMTPPASIGSTDPDPEAPR